MPKAEMRTAKRTARNEPPSIFFFSRSFCRLSLSLSLLVVGKEMTSNYKSFRVSKKRKKVREEKAADSYSRGSARYIHTHINRDHERIRDTRADTHARCDSHTYIYILTPTYRTD